MNWVKKYPLLEKEEETDLLRAAISGDEQAKDKLVCSNLRFVVYKIGQYCQDGVSFMDLVQEGNIGLIKAVDKYKPQFLGRVRFVSYAGYWVNISIRKALPSLYSAVCLSPVDFSLLKKVQFLEREGKSLEEIALFLHKPANEIQNLTASQEDFSLNEPRFPYEPENESFLDNLADEKNLPPENSQIREALLQIMKKELSETEVGILKLRNEFEQDQSYTLAEIGQLYGMTRERIRQIESGAKNKLNGVDDLKSLMYK